MIATLFDRTWFRFAVLVLICLFGLGGYLAYDSIGVVESELERDLQLSPAQFG